MLLDEPTVRQILRLEDIIPLMEQALAAFSRGEVVQPVRSVLPVDEHQAFLGLMPAYTGQALGVKLVSVYPRNTDLPSHQAVIQLFDPETGEPLVTMDGTKRHQPYQPEPIPGVAIPGHWL